MWTRGGLKAQAKEAFKMNYWKCVIVSIIMGILTAATTSASINTTTENVNYDPTTEQGMEVIYNNFSNQINSLTDQQVVVFAAAVAGGITLIIIVSILLETFLFNPLLVGCNAFFKKNVIEPPAELGEIGVGFRNYVHNFVTLFLTDLFTVLWTLLLIIPGIIKMYSYRMVPYILADHPELSATETITLSRKMMKDQKFDAFILDLSFIGWALLSVLTLGIVGIFWYGPYKYNTDAALYLAVKDNVQL